MILAAITAMQKIIWHAAAQRSRSHPAVRRKKKAAAHEPARQSTKQGQNRSTQSRKTAGSRSSGSRSTTARSSSAKRPQHGKAAKRNREELAIKPWFIVLLVVLLLGLADACMEQWAQPDRL